MNKTNQSWTCTCGSNNDTQFCPVCGKPRPSENNVAETVAANYQPQNPIYQQPPAYQQPMYQQAPIYQPVPAPQVFRGGTDLKKEIKEMSGSWWVLVLAIAATVIAIITAITTITNYGGVFNLFVSLIRLLLTVLVAAGFWNIWVTGRNKTRGISVSGLNMLKGVVKTYYAVIMVAICLVIVGFVILLSIADGINNIVQDLTDVGLGKEIGSIAAVVFVVLGIAIVIVVLYFKSILNILADVKDRGTRASLMESKGFIMTAVMLFIMAAVNILSYLGTQVATSFINAIMKEVLPNADTQQIGGGSMTMSLVLDICTIFLYLFGGILVIKYHSLIKKATEKALQES